MIARVQPIMEEGGAGGKGYRFLPKRMLAAPFVGRGKFRMDIRPPCLRRIPGWVQKTSVQVSRVNGLF
jgi:hypothetical protein